MLKDSDEKRSPKASYLLVADSNQEEDIIVTPKLNDKCRYSRTGARQHRHHFESH